MILENKAAKILDFDCLQKLKFVRIQYILKGQYIVAIEPGAIRAVRLLEQLQLLVIVASQSQLCD